MSGEMDRGGWSGGEWASDGSRSLTLASRVSALERQASPWSDEGATEAPGSVQQVCLLCLNPCETRQETRFRQA